MAFDEKGYRQAARQAGVPSNIIEETVAKNTGVKGWLTGGKQGLGAVGSALGNVLNLPSYALGGVANRLQQATGSKYGQGEKQGLGIMEGIKNKRALMTEAPELLGVDPNSTAGMAIGFGAELLTPDPLGAGYDAFKFARGADKIGDAAKAGGLFSRGTEGIANTLRAKSYKMPESSISKIAEAIGVDEFDPDKANKVFSYLDNLGAQGASRYSVGKIGDVAGGVQSKYNAMVRSGSEVGRDTYARALMQQADELASVADDPTTRKAIEALKREAKVQSNAAKQGLKMSDTFLTNTKTRAFNASRGSIGDPLRMTENEGIGRAGVRALEEYAPGSKALGTELRGLRTAQEEVAKKANTGLGTQLFNAFKPSAAGATIGAGVGYSTGQDPLQSGLLGAVGTTVASNPRVLNLASRGIRKIPNVGSAIPSNVVTRTGMSALKRTPQTAFRVSQQPKLSQTESQERSKRSKQKSRSYGSNSTSDNFNIKVFRR